MSQVQSGILPEHCRAAIWIEANVKGEVDALRAASKTFADKLATFEAKFPDAHLGAVVAFGNNTWRALSGGVGAEGGDARRLQGVHHAQCQGVIGGDHHEVHGVLLGPGHHGLHVRGLDGHALGHLGDAPVARERINHLHRRTFFQFFYDRMLTASAADHHQFHKLPFRAAAADALIHLFSILS